MPARAITRRLDLILFCIADLQTGFGPFVVVYLISNGWNQADIGLVIGAGTLAAMSGQVPAGMLVDRMRHKATALSAALIGIGTAAAIIAVSAAFGLILIAQALHGFASSMLSPALAALTLSLVSHSELAARLGRNATFSALGSFAGAAMMGVLGSWTGPQSVFWLAAALCLPPLILLRATGLQSGAPASASPAEDEPREPILAVLTDWRTLAYLACAVLFFLSNAPMLVLASAEITRTAGDSASMIIAACVMVPQFCVALFSPLVGKLAERRGRRIVLAIGFLALPTRALALAVIEEPLWIVPIQVLDGLAGAVFGVLTPLVMADISGARGRFNLRLGIVGMAIAGAAALSNVTAGAIAATLGTNTAFYALAIAGALAVLAALLLMPETRPPPD